MTIPHTTPPVWPADISSSRFASTISRDSTRACRIALLGLPDDLGVKLNHGRPGAAEGPAAFRAALARYGATDPAGAPWPRVYDAGDLAPSGDSLEETHARITAATIALLERDLLPIGIGGGHDLTFPFVRAVAQKFSPLGGIYFDAHLDVRQTDGSGMAFRRLINECDVGPLHIHGFRPLVNTREHHAWFVEHGGRAHVDDDAAPALPGDVPHLFASVDLDVLDMAHAPGVSAPNPCGWTPREAERWVIACGADPRTRCFDLMELCPPHDEGGRTARLAVHLFLAFLAGFAARP